MNQTFKVKRYKGRKYYLLNLPNTDSFRFSVVTKMGANFERHYLDRKNQNIYGICHFIEHLSFKSPRDYSTDDLMSNLNIFGSYNAFTGRENITYFHQGIMDYMNKSINMVCNVAFNDLSKLTTEEFDHEKNVVLNEIGMYLDNPDAVFSGAVMANIRNTVSEDNILGSKETVSNITLDDVKKIKKIMLESATHEYQVVYDGSEISEKELLETLHEKISDFDISLDHQTDIWSRLDYTYVEHKLSNTHITMDSSQDRLDIVIPFSKNDGIHNSIVAGYLGNLSDNSIIDLVREQHGLVYGIHTVFTKIDGNFYLNISCETNKGNIPDVIKYVKESIHKVADNFTDDQMTDIMMREKVNLSKTFMNQGNLFGLFNTAIRSPEKLDQMPELSDNIKLALTNANSKVTADVIKSSLDEIKNQVDTGNFIVYTTDNEAIK